MRRPLILIAVAATLAGCATVRDSRLNPLNWFGGGREVRVAEGAANPLVPSRSAFARPEEVYPGEPIDRITALRIEPVPSGAIIHATGVALRQGAYAVQLTPANDADVPVGGVLSYTFDVVYPATATRQGPVRTREIVAARAVSNEVLAQTRVIRVVAARNAQESRRGVARGPGPTSVPRAALPQVEGEVRVEEPPAQIRRRTDDDRPPPGGTVPRP